MNSPPECGAVFDCNVLLQAAARKSGPAAACLRLVEKDFVRLYLSEEILTEISEVLSRPQVQSQFPELTDDIVVAFIDRLKHTAYTVVRIVPRKSPTSEMWTMSATSIWQSKRRPTTSSAAIEICLT